MTNKTNNTEKTASVPRGFAALYHPQYRIYFIATALAMMADNIEHVISYWMLYQKFHSPTLGGIAVLTHWLPFLLFSVYSGLSLTVTIVGGLFKLVWVSLCWPP